MCLSFNSRYQLNIKNILKWYKYLQGVFETYLDPIFGVTKHFQVNVYTVMCKNVLQTFSKQTILLKTLNI